MRLAQYINIYNKKTVINIQVFGKKMMLSINYVIQVNARYRQYYQQMRMVESSFQMMAGPGSAKRYTALALQTISRQFRCLRDATNKQIQVNRLALGEQVETLNSHVLPRLRYVDKHFRQQRTIQQLGVAQHSWRPQKGLPETAVSVLRAWLFEHFLNPYVSLAVFFLIRIYLFWF